jgi:hypothetical protein
LLTRYLEPATAPLYPKTPPVTPPPSPPKKVKYGVVFVPYLLSISCPTISPAFDPTTPPVAPVASVRIVGTSPISDIEVSVPAPPAPVAIPVTFAFK